MATRRSRIKGVLNIPARKKTGEPSKAADLNNQDTRTNDNEDKTIISIENETCESNKSNVPEKHVVDDTSQKTTTDSSECVQIAFSNLQSPKPESTVSGISKLPVNTENAVRIDIEPPPSPTKINRTRIKAIPRLGQRRVSFNVGSASESEDDGRRQSTRHRNDSVCSLASNVEENRQQQATPVGRQHMDTNVMETSTTTSISATHNTSPMKKEFNCVIQRKCRRTEQARKLATAKRDFLHKFRGDTPPDRHRLTMMDLIFYNPNTNPMSPDVGKGTTSKDDKKEDQVNVEHVDDSGRKAEEEIDDPDDQDDTIAPQVTVNDDGEIIIDEKSLLIENKSTVKGRQKMEQAHLVDGDENTGYGIYKRVKRTKDWSKIETLRFYKALNTIGTDFTLMVKLFPSRTRRELKMKFKKEERINHALIDKAVLEPVQFDMRDLEADLEKQLIQQKELELRKKEVSVAKCVIRQRRLKKPPPINSRENTIKDAIEDTDSKIADPKPKPKIVNSVLEVLDQSDDENNTESEVEEDENSKDSEDYIPPSTHHLTAPTVGVKRPKRNPNSRHIFKKTKLLRVDPLFTKSDEYVRESSTKDEEETLEPGSLMIVKNTEKDSTEPEYKIFMITADKRKVPIELSSEIVKNLATNAGKGAISEDHDIVLGIENNYTIDEEVEENNFTINEEQIDDVITCDMGKTPNSPGIMEPGHSISAINDDDTQSDEDILILPFD